MVGGVVLLILVLSSLGGSGDSGPRGPLCVDGTTLFEPDEVGYLFTFCDDDRDGEFDRQELTNP